MHSRRSYRWFNLARGGRASPAPNLPIWRTVRTLSSGGPNETVASVGDTAPGNLGLRPATSAGAATSRRRRPLCGRIGRQHHHRAANTTTAFDGNYGTVVVRQVSPGCADPRFADVYLTIQNGLAQAQGRNLTFQGYVTPQGALAMHSQLGQTFQGQISPNFVVTGRAQGPNCAWDVTWNRVRTG